MAPGMPLECGFAPRAPRRFGICRNLPSGAWNSQEKPFPGIRLLLPRLRSAGDGSGSSRRFPGSIRLLFQAGIPVLGMGRDPEAGIVLRMEKWDCGEGKSGNLGVEKVGLWGWKKQDSRKGESGNLGRENGNLRGGKSGILEVEQLDFWKGKVGMSG